MTTIKEEIKNKRDELSKQHNRILHNEHLLQNVTLAVNALAMNFKNDKDSLARQIKELDDQNTKLALNDVCFEQEQFQYKTCHIETFAQIATKFYGMPEFKHKIIEANPGAIDNGQANRLLIIPGYVPNTTYKTKKGIAILIGTPFRKANTFVHTIHGDVEVFFGNTGIGTMSFKNLYELLMDDDLLVRVS